MLHLGEPSTIDAGRALARRHARPVDLSQVIARNARAIRAAQQRRQVDVAAAGGISRSTLSLIESGARLITVRDLLALCAGLDVRLRELVAGADAEDLELLGL